MAENEDPTHIATDRARGGATPHMTRWVLAGSMLLIIVVFAIIFWAGA